MGTKKKGFFDSFKKTLFPFIFLCARRLLWTQRHSLDFISFGQCTPLNYFLWVEKCATFATEHCLTICPRRLIPVIFGTRLSKHHRIEHYRFSLIFSPNIFQKKFKENFFCNHNQVWTLWLDSLQLTWVDIVLYVCKVRASNLNFKAQIQVFISYGFYRIFVIKKYGLLLKQSYFILFSSCSI